VDHGEETFEGGVISVFDRYLKRRAPFRFAKWEELPPADADFDAIAATVVRKIPDPLPKGHTRYGQRMQETAREFAGRSGLLLLNALLIMNLRKSGWPERAPVLFNRLWTEKRDFLLAELNGRWLISSLITFGDHGATEADRRVGRSLGLLFSVMKLYESERLFSGRAGTEPFRKADRVVAPLPMEMEPFSLMSGDLEAHLLAPLLTEAGEAPVAGPLAEHLLEMLNRDPQNLFRRLKLMREQTAAKG
jgi:hypothetical protein